MVRKISVPVGTLEVTTSTANPRAAQQNGSRGFTEVEGIRFVRQGQKVVLRAIDGIVIAAGGQRMVVTDTHSDDVVTKVIKAFKACGVSSSEIDMFIQYPTPGTEGMLVSQARRAGIRFVWVMHAVGDVAPHGRNQKYVMVKRSV